MAVAVDSGMDEGIAINGCLALGVMIQPGPSPDPPALPLGIRPGFLTSRWTSSPVRLILMAVSRENLEKKSVRHASLSPRLDHPLSVAVSDPAGSIPRNPRGIEVES